ncbi:hypothetical protein [Pedobacter punctiformis]|uniref:WG repeat-containing protein n=1 Tax=Pedobacter punctiformis TaxID=3004097 RepID=A0ABT4LBQ0_9SPHI|nr:hypothetical protein [Pedobacter sp. HCMS5-2]MCZ4245291.1 hypothetical protein [Pedobacter sp. HCMS5-2]
MLENSDRSNFILIDNKGKEICSYSYIYQPYIDNDYLLVRKDIFKDHFKYGIINHLGKIIKKIKFDKIEFRENSIIFKADKSYLITDLNFNRKFEISKAQELNFISNELILVKISDRKWKLITEYGKEKLEIAAEKVEYNNRRSLKVINETESYFIDFDGNKVK